MNLFKGKIEPSTILGEEMVDAMKEFNILCEILIIHEVYVVALMKDNNLIIDIMKKK